MRKRNEECPQRRWMESDASLEVYTVDQVHHKPLRLECNYIYFHYPQFFDAPPTSRHSDNQHPVPQNNHPILPPPSYELAVASNPDFATTNNPNKLLQLFSAKPKCHCQLLKPQQNQLLPAHLQYDLVKKCRQCRRIIRDYPDSDTEQSGSEFCECLLQNTTENEFPSEVVEHPATGSTCRAIEHAELIDDHHDPEGPSRCGSADALDETGLPSYRTAAKLSLIANDQ